MQLEDFFDFSEPDYIRLKGHRIGIEDIVWLYRDGYSPERIAQPFPGLSLEQVYATITYYLIHRVDVDAYLDRAEKESEQEYREWAENPSPAVQRLRESGSQYTGGTP